MEKSRVDEMDMETKELNRKVPEAAARADPLDSESYTSDRPESDIGQEYLDNGPVLLIVTVEYDRYVGRAQFLQLRKAIYERLSYGEKYQSVLVTGVAGRYRSFEIWLQHKLVYSCLDTSDNPSIRSVIDAIHDALDGRPILTCESASNHWARTENW